MSAKAFFSNETGNVRLEMSNGQSATFEKVSSMVNYCNEFGIELVDCQPE